jgi:predicted lipid carrier protein YhbT
MPLPGLVTLALRPLPLLPLQLLLQGLVVGIANRHPELLERLAAGRGRCIGIDPSDLPFAMLLVPNEDAISLRVVRGLAHGSTDARIRGPIVALMGLVDGTYDGDALFFSRDITVEGDIEAVLALRNAVDDASIDLLHEAVALTGPLAAVCRHAARSWPARRATALARQAWSVG